MSFDVFVQGFAAGDAAPLDADKVFAALGPAVEEEVGLFMAEPTMGCMFANPTDAGLDAVARLLLDADAVAFWPAVVLTAVIGSEAKAADVPDDFERIVVVGSGAEIARAIAALDG